MSANQPRTKSQHQEFDIVFVIRFSEFTEKAFYSSLRIVQDINWQEVSALMYSILTFLFPFVCFNCPLKLCLFSFSHYAALVVGKKLHRVVIIRTVRA